MPDKIAFFASKGKKSDFSGMTIREKTIMIRFLFALIFVLLPAQAFALAGDWVRDEGVAVRLIAGQNAVGDGGAVPLGLELQLEEGWHTYWRSPGEAGLPPQLDWSRSQTEENNLQAATLWYPAPHRYTAYGLETIGYRDHVVFPIDAVLRHAGRALKADVSVDLLICGSLCMPKHFDLTLAVPAGAAAGGAEAELLHLARDDVPSDSATSGLLLKGVSGDGKSLTFAITSRDPLTQPDIFIENDKNIGFGAPEIVVGALGFEASLTVRPVETLPAGVSLAKLPLTLTIVSGDHATEIRTETSAPPALLSSAAYVRHSVSFSFALLFALIGGFLLNLMPCVLPVLSLKIVSVVSHGGGEARKVRQSFLTTAAGIVFSFLVLACAMVLLKHLGLALGWGVQFQQPAFLMFLILLLVFFAANLWGLFEIPLPRFLVDRMDRAYHPKLVGDFATGAFATLLATPCSAPFLGTAIGFALAGGATEILAVFAALGLGMATPYLTVALFPRAATLLPKPGLWMVRLRHILGLALALTALWLIWVMAAQIAVSRAVGFGLLMIVLMLLLILKKRGLSRHLMQGGIIFVCAAALALGLYGETKPAALPHSEGLWQVFNEAVMNADLAEGKTVFLDVTAAWCLTCKANAKFTLSNPEVAQRLFHGDIVAMQADWTNPDPVVIDLLHKYGRYGIPFNVVFGAAAPQGIVLPELLTPALVLKALDEASGR